MRTFAQQIADLQHEGYTLAEAQAKVAHDAILCAIGRSGFKPNSTIKGGVVMCELTKELRRTTMDLDIDFVRYSISKTAITRIVAKWAHDSGYRIAISGDIQDLRQQDYRGKRILLDISDGSTKVPLRTKIDIGVHSHTEIVQEERRFAILSHETDRTLYANTPEQVFTEKLLSLLRHGILSTRTKDVFDMYYLSKRLNRKRLRQMLDVLVLSNPNSPIQVPGEIIAAIGRTFQSKRFMRDMASPKSNWLNESPEKVSSGLISFLSTILA